MKAGPARRNPSSLQAAINAEIVTAAQSGQASLLAVVTQHLPNMKLVNLATSMHRLARAKLDAEAPCWQHLIAASSEQLEQVNSVDSKLARVLSNISWSLATVGLVDRAFMELVMGVTITHLPHHKPCELAMLLWAMAKLGEEGVPSTLVQARLFGAAAQHVVAIIDNFEFHSLSAVAWAYGKVGMLDEELFSAMSSVIKRRQSAHASSLGAVVNFIWAFGVLSWKDDELIAALAGACLQCAGDCKPQEIVNVLMGLSKGGYEHESLVFALLRRTTEVDMTADQNADILECCCELLKDCPTKGTVLLPIVRRCIAVIESTPSAPLARLLLAAAQIYEDVDHNLDEEEQDPVQQLFSRAACLLVPDLGAMCDRSLVHIASAITILAPSGPGEDHFLTLMDGVENEVLERLDVMAPRDMISLMCNFVITLDTSGHVVAQLAGALVRTWHTLQVQELQDLTRIYHLTAEVGEEQSETNLYEWCCSLCALPPLPDA